MGGDKIKIPKNEILWVSYLDKNGVVRYITTSDIMRTKYILYSVSNEKLTKVSMGKSPTKFDEIIYDGGN